MLTPIAQFANALQLQAPKFRVDLSREAIAKLGAYYGLVLKWNPRLHLVAPCSPDEFAERHVLESLFLLKHLPIKSSVVDVGSGAGLPIVPCLLVRNDLRATLIESSKKRTLFLREAVRPLRPERVQLVAQRFREVTPPKADFLTCRALDKFSQRLPELIEWADYGTTFLFFAGNNLVS